MTLTVAPGSDEWLRTITPSKVASILGVSKWESGFGLWNRIKGLVPPDPPKENFAAGHFFESTMAEFWKAENPGWRLSPGEVQIAGDPDRWGFPYAATLDRRAVRGAHRRVVEFKIANDGEDGEYGEELSDEVPPGYAVQVLMQMAFTGYTQFPGHLMVLPPRYKPKTFEIPWDAAFAEEIIAECKQFWDSLSQDTPPPLDDHKATWDCVRKLHPEIDGATADVDPQLAADLFAANAAHKESEDRLRGLKTRLLDQMGNAKYARVYDTVIADRRAHAKGGVALVLSRKALPDYVLQGEPA